MADNQDKNIALLGIAATKNSLNLECPPENIMSAFIEGRLDSGMRTKMLSHINQCEDCYFTWEQTSVFLAQNNAPVVEQHTANKVGFLKRLENWLNSGASWKTAVSGIALASLAIALVVNLPDNYKSGYLDQSVVATTLDADTLAHVINQLPVPWKNQTFGFNNSAYTAPAKAIGVGIWNARKSLMNSDDPLPVQLVSEPAINWRDSEYHDYYAFGIWILDAWILGNAGHVKPRQWALLRESLQTLEAGLQQRKQSETQAAIALQTIDRMKSSLDYLSQKSDLTAQRALLREIELGLQKLSL